MNRRWKRITTYATVLLLAAQILMASVCYAEGEEFTYRTLRDETLYISAPKSWQIEETGSLDEDADSVKNDELVYKVFELQNQDGAKQGEMWICAEPYDNSFYYCDTEAEAEDYLEQAGTDAVEHVVDTALPTASGWIISDPAYLKGEEEFTYVIRQKAKVGGKNYLIYLNCDFIQA